jgi:hypothetical protein
MITPEAAAMPRYYFVLHTPDRRHEDPFGIELPNAEAAHVHGHKLARELREGGGFGLPGPVMVVQDETGDIIQSIPI